MKDQNHQKIFTNDFILVFLAQFAFSIAYHLLLPTLPIYLSKIGVKEARIGILIGIFGISALVLRPFIGKALLKIHGKYFMMTGALIFSITSGAYLIAKPFWPFLIVRLSQGAGFAFFNTAAIIFIANITPELHRGKTLGYFLLAINISFAVAPSIGMFIINHFSFTLLFLTCIALSLCSLFITNRLEENKITDVGDVSDSGLLSTKALKASIVGFLFFFIFGSLTTFFPLYAIESGVKNPGFFFTTIAIMLILGRTLGGRIIDLYRRELILFPCIILSIISMLILSFSKSLPMFIIVGIIWGIGHAFFYPTLVAYILDHVGASKGPALGTFTGLQDLGITVGPVIMGMIINLTDYQIMFLTLAFTGLINLIYFYSSV